MDKISDKQLRIYEYICQCVKSNGYPPSVREIGQAVGLSSPSTVHKHLNALEAAGYISRENGKTRAISLAAPAGGVPLIGTVAAGRPVLAVEDIVGYLPYFPDDGGEYFALSIKGDSMINAGILEGDTVIVRRASTAESGEIVIALIEDEATCKRLSMKNGKVLLLPENDSYEPIDGTNSKILGKFTAVIRTY